MKLKKNREPVNQTQTNDDADDVMQELDAGDLHRISGAGNPFADVPREDNQSIDSDLRSNG